jgi:hypothetical protein
MKAKATPTKEYQRIERGVQRVLTAAGVSAGSVRHDTRYTPTPDGAWVVSLHAPSGVMLCQDRAPTFAEAQTWALKKWKQVEESHGAT